MQSEKRRINAVMKPKMRNSIANTVKIALFAAIISVTAMITIPFAVPITLQALGVFSALFILGGKRGCVAVAVYVAIGAVGIPVFSGFTGGIGRLFDLTGGFIWGFILAALAFWLCEIIFSKSRAFFIVAPTVSLLIIYLSGCIQFAIVSSSNGNSVGFVSVLTACVLPFILLDILKIILAYIISRRLKRIMPKI